MRSFKSFSPAASRFACDRGAGFKRRRAAAGDGTAAPEVDMRLTGVDSGRHGGLDFPHETAACATEIQGVMGAPAGDLVVGGARLYRGDLVHALAVRKAHLRVPFNNHSRGVGGALEHCRSSRLGQWDTRELPQGEGVPFNGDSRGLLKGR